MKRLGDRVGHIRLVDHLGTGGMGDVFVGRDELLERDVAVKAIRPERLSPELHERMVREARLLSALNHENICRIYDLLEEDDDLFLVLELIPGRDLRQVVDEGLEDGSRLEPEAALDIALQIARALEVAHGLGIVHRDLKLENVRLRRDGQVKILDFGVGRSGSRSRAQGDRIARLGTDRFGLTGLGDTIGTRAAMSPEQARAEPVGVASDIYSFGLLLQELLTGRSPYPEGIDAEVLRMRTIDGDTLPPEGLDADAEQLLYDALEPDPTDRPTASQLVDRLERLRERPLRRRRFAALVVLLLLALGVGGKYTVDLRRERNAALEAQQVAEQRGREAEAVVDFLVRLFEVSDPTRQDLAARDPRATEILERGADELRSSLGDQPLVRARLLEAIGAVSRTLGQVERAEALLAEALALRARHQPPEHLELVRTQSQLGDLLRSLGRYDEAREKLEASHRALHATGADATEIAEVLNRLGALELDRGRLDQAASLFEEGIALHLQAVGRDDRLIAAAQNNLAIVELHRGRLAEAGALHEQVLETRRRLLGANHPDVATSLNNLAVVRYLEGDLEASEGHMRRALEIWRDAYGDEHPEVATAVYNLGDLARERGRLDEAESLYRDALASWTRVYGDDHIDLAYAWHGLGHVARARGDRGAALEAYRNALTLREAMLPADHPDVVEARDDLESMQTSGPPS